MHISESEKLSLEMACRLDDPQKFYSEALLRHVDEAAARCIATLYLLSCDGNILAKDILRQCDNAWVVSRLFLQCRELEVIARSIIHAYTSKDSNNVNACLLELALLLSPCDDNHYTDHLNRVIVSSGSLAHFPIIAKTVEVKEEVDFNKIVELAAYSSTNGTTLSDAVSLYSHGLTTLGIRLSIRATQPSDTGNEFQVIETGIAPQNATINIVKNVLEGLKFLSLTLSLSISQVMKVYAVCPRTSSARKAGSVSVLPGCAWQDVDLVANPVIEYCHLSAQIVHEYFHTKLNLIEQSTKLYFGDGQLPEVFSPWKNRMRPLRQVIHALFTFSAGAEVYVRLMECGYANTQDAQEHARLYLIENMQFAEIGCKELFNSEGLTGDGKELVSACVDNLRSVVKRVGL